MLHILDLRSSDIGAIAMFQIVSGIELEGVTRQSNGSDEGRIGN